VNRTTTLLPSFLLAASLLVSCSTVAETGRMQLKWFDDTQMNQMGVEAYETACKDHKVITGTAEAAMVQRIGQKIAAVSGKNYAWEFRLLDAPDVVNAFCLPGGKVAVYTGILKVTQNEDGLAAVMGHEVAHATCDHGNERVSHGSVKDAVVGTAGKFAGFAGLGASGQQLVMQTLNAGASVLGILPYSRAHETEADEVGLLYLVRAGYNPEEAPKLWERMAGLSGGGESAGIIAKFLSTHPASEDRAKRLRELIPVMRERVAKERASGSANAATGTDKQVAPPAK
jgi:predicted Zn-dependent protease